MVGIGGEEVALWITGVQKQKRRRQKSCLWTGLIHSGEDSTKSGYKKTKNVQKNLACGLGLGPVLSLLTILVSTILW
jgi:hypothetical protein